MQEREPRPLTNRESNWIIEILQANDDWKACDISRTRVFAERPCDEGISILLRAPEPENSKTGLLTGYLGRILIFTDDDCMLEVQLTQFGGRLNELYVLFSDPKHPERRLPDSWKEVSHEVLGES